jgi:hypothetical protein
LIAPQGKQVESSAPPGEDSSEKPVAELSQNPIVLTLFGMAFERKQIPRVEKTLGKRETRENRWSRLSFAQDRISGLPTLTITDDPVAQKRGLPKYCGDLGFFRGRSKFSC